MEKHYSIKETSNLLGIKVRTVREWIRNEKIKAVKYPDCAMWFIPESEISRIIGKVSQNEEQSC